MGNEDEDDEDEDEKVEDEDDDEGEEGTVGEVGLLTGRSEEETVVEVLLRALGPVEEEEGRSEVLMLPEMDLVLPNSDTLSFRDILLSWSLSFSSLSLLFVLLLCSGFLCF